jgi:hypothetical protein
VPEVTLLPAPDLNSGLPRRWSARVTVHGDRVVRRTCDQARPPTADAVVAKFRRQIGPACADADASAWITRCLALDEAPRAGVLRRPPQARHLPGY